MKHSLGWTTDSYVLVEQWKTSSTLGLWMAVIASCAVTGLYEWLRRCLQIWDTTEHVVCSGKGYQIFCLRTLRSVLHAISASVSYVIMLFLMTYNVWVMMGSLVGSAIGYLVLAPAMYGLSSRTTAKYPGRPNSRRVGRHYDAMSVKKETKSPPPCSLLEEDIDQNGKDQERGIVTGSDGSKINSGIKERLFLDKGGNPIKVTNPSTDKGVTSLSSKARSDATIEERLDLLQDC